MYTYQQLPVFAANQVLSHNHLNDAVTFLEEQDRLSRNQLVGVGIVCGFNISYDASNNRLSMSRGVGVTSKGFLICADALTFGGIKDYTLRGEDGELTQLEEDIFAEKPYTERIDLHRTLSGVYQFFRKNNNPDEIVPLKELVTVGDMNADIQPLSLDDMEGKVLLAYLKLDLESLRNCTPVDCDDKGATLNFTLKFLVADENIAKQIIDREDEIVNRTDKEQRYIPRPLRLPHKFSRVNLSKVNVRTAQNIAGIANAYRGAITAALTDLGAALKTTFTTYRFALNTLYPGGVDFEAEINNNILKNLTSNDLHAQYYYDFTAHLIDAYEEFMEAALAYSAECHPVEQAFPRHLFIGKMTDLKEDVGPQVLARPTFITTGSGFVPQLQRDPYRHYFIPSPAFSGQNILLEKLRTLHYRIYQMLQAVDISIIIKSSLHITPSRLHTHAVSERAIPGYLQLFNSNLALNWNYDKTTANRYSEIYGYLFTAFNPSLLRNRIRTADFHRVEGHIGSALRSSIIDIEQIRNSNLLDFDIKILGLGMSTDNVEVDNTNRYVHNFNDFMSKHVGSVHQSGVPVGGTLVIVCVPILDSAPVPPVLIDDFRTTLDIERPTASLPDDLTTTIPRTPSRTPPVSRDFTTITRKTLSRTSPVVGDLTSKTSESSVPTTATFVNDRFAEFRDMLANAANDALIKEFDRAILDISAIIEEPDVSIPEITPDTKWTVVADFALSYRCCDMNIPISDNILPTDKTISGRVVDDKTNEALIGVPVVIGGTGGTTTDINGNYTFTSQQAPPWTVTVKVSFPGYNDYVEELVVENTLAHDIRLVTETPLS